MIGFINKNERIDGSSTTVRNDDSELLCEIKAMLEDFFQHLGDLQENRLGEWQGS